MFQGAILIVALLFAAPAMPWLPADVVSHVSRTPLETRPPSHLCSAAAGDANLPSAGKASKAASDLGKKAVNSLPNAPDLSNPKGSKDSSFPTIGKATKPGNPLAVSCALAFHALLCCLSDAVCRYHKPSWPPDVTQRGQYRKCRHVVHGLAQTACAGHF